MPTENQSSTKNMHGDSMLLTSGPFSFGISDPLVYGNVVPVAQTRSKRVAAQTSEAPPLSLFDTITPSNDKKTSAMKKVKSLDFHATTKTIPLEKASRFSQERPSWKQPQDRKRQSFNDALILLEEEPDDSTFLQTMNARRFPLVLSFLMLCLFSWSHASTRGTTLGCPPPKQGGALASAALSSITSTLSPILPFTGGVDLRRVQTEESWLDSAKSVVAQTKSAFGLDISTKEEENGLMDQVLEMPRAGGQIHSKQHKSKQAPIISDSKPFLPQEKIAELTLDDMTLLFSHAMNPDDNKSSKFSDKLKPIVAEMDAVVRKSRGSSSITTPSSTTADNRDIPSTGSMDALYFCAILRLFAEWRIVRQVPQGYKGYAVGMNLGHRDVVQNLVKLESAIHHYISIHSQSPTLRELLEFEISLGKHVKLPRLEEKSAAMGLLWVRRQLHYQTRVFDNILQVPSVYPTSQQAVANAYTTVYGQYHGWAVQKIFNYSFQAAPQVTEIYKYMNPILLQQVTDKARRLDVSPKQEEEELSTIDDSTTNNNKPKGNNPLERFLHHVGGEFEKLVHHLGGEWDKLVDNVVRVLDQDASSHNNNKRDKDATRVRGGSSNDDDEKERFISQQMEQDAHERIARYLTQVEPLLEDLAGLFDDLNMDDPSKV